MTGLFSQFPPPCQPFLVRDDFVVRADLFPLPGTYNGRLETRHFELDDQFEIYLEQRLASLHRAVDKYRCVAPDDPPALAEVYWRLFKTLAGEYPGVVRLERRGIVLAHLGINLDLTDRLNIGVSVQSGAPPIGIRAANWLSAQSGLDRFGDALALAVQEDIVIMRLRADDTHLAESLHVLLPSTWNPREKYQQSFGKIHEPVAESDRLVSSSLNVMKAMVTRGPYVRFGLSMTTMMSLDSHPDHQKPWDDAWLEDPDLLASKCVVRIERQTTLPMPDLGRALFSVRIYNTPLTNLAQSRPDLVARLATIMASASPAVLEYKGMTSYADPIANWCRDQTAGS